MLDFLAGISTCAPRVERLNVLVNEWNLQQNPDPRALRSETHRSVQHGRSLPDALNPQALRRDGGGFSIEPGAVIGDNHVQAFSGAGKNNADRVSSRMFRDIG